MKSPLRILIVSPDRKLVRLQQVNLARQSYETGVAFSGGEALAQLQAEHFDIAAVDRNLIDMTGRELNEQIRANPDWTHIKFIFLSNKDAGA